MTARYQTIDTQTAGAVRRLPAALFAAVAAATREMPFLDHLEELRRRLLWTVAVVGAVFCGCWFFAAPLYDIVSAPVRANPTVTLTIDRAQDIFSLYAKVSLMASLFVSAPFILTQAWLFISPGLYPHERRYAVPFVVSSSLLFIAGGAFGYFVAFPPAMAMLISMTVRAHLTPMINAVDYFDLFCSIMITLGIVFQIPAVIFVLSRIGLVNARFLVRYLRHAIFFSAAVAAIVTPTTDIGTMMVITVPMVALYCLGILVAAVFGRRRVEPAS